MTIGITDHAQAALGDLVFVEPPKPGRKLNAGETVRVVESVKARATSMRPWRARSSASNDALSGAPEEVNEDAYAAWMFRLRPANPRRSPA